MPWIPVREPVTYYASPRGAGTPLLLIHELGGSHKSWQHVVPALTALCTTYAVDLPGAGWSEKPVEPCSLEELADHLADSLAALEIHSAIDVGGLAMGAVIACMLAIRHPGRVRSLVLCDGTAEVTPNARRYLLDRASLVRANGMRAAVDSSVQNSFPERVALRCPEALAQYRMHFLANDPAAYARHSEALAAAEITGEALASLRCPTLVLSGAADFIWGPATGTRLASAIPDASFRIVDDAGHFPPIQAPEQFLAHVLPFLGRLQ